MELTEVPCKYRRSDGSCRPTFRTRFTGSAGRCGENAFSDAHASHIEAEIHYDKHHLRLRIRDDGKGIAWNILEEGARVGHWGLPGIRERGKRIEGRFDI